ncbi:hypothetical protein CTE05_14140 [Cellulomonas terrae]|uniref:Uncharacterized protein n=1 Tax=Cellulomonas terrae TaxID=311234 RepID=A0A511JIP2_9CELL|nr:hypothetical protein CTE05_14140 [Cellulomonas terrae]
MADVVSAAGVHLERKRCARSPQGHGPRPRRTARRRGGAATFRASPEAHRSASPPWRGDLPGRPEAHQLGDGAAARRPSRLGPDAHQLCDGAAARRPSGLGPDAHQLCDGAADG